MSLRAKLTNPGRYIRHPSPATSPWLDGDSWDAGTAMLVDNNVSHLCDEGYRHLFSDARSFVAGNTHGGDPNPWDGLVEGGGRAAAAEPGDVNFIPWSYVDARQYGPFPIIADRLVDGGQGLFGLRRLNIRAHVNLAYAVFASDDAVSLYAAATLNHAIPGLGTDSYLAFSSRTYLPVDMGAGGEFFWDASFAIDAAPGTTPWSARADGLSSSNVVPISLWFGWSTTDNGVLTVLAVDGWEST